MKKSKEQISNFYDEYVENQIKSGINDRIFNLYKRMLKRKISTNSNLLEIGCGIGHFTFLISKKIQNGAIEAFDISKESIEYAKSKIQNKNVNFSVSDILDYNPTQNKFDFITLFDVIEHIPEKEHQEMFQRIANWMHEDSEILINIPNPHYILYDKKYQPEVLQIIDQPIFLENLTPKLASTNLEIIYFETHSIWVKDDYNYMIIKKRKDFVEEFLSNKRNLFQKVINKANLFIRNYYYNFSKIICIINF